MRIEAVLDLGFEGLVRATSENDLYRIFQSLNPAYVMAISPAGKTIAMEQILANLLGNAIKFLPPDKPGEIRIRAESTPEETVFLVEDNGRGIPAEARTAVFEIFRRFGPAGVPGEGMGLSYVQVLVHRHGGRIWCESEPGSGSRFWFTIPHDRPEAD
jgi:signal transduction histidine kinase